MSVIERMVADLQAGIPPDWESIARQHPDEVAELRSLWPTVAALANIELTRDPIHLHTSTKTRDEESYLGQLGDFELNSEIGRGGMGIVYRAVQITLRREVALKILPLAGSLDERQLKRFKNEAAAAASMHHAHIVPVYVIGQDRGVHFLAMKLIDGPDLARIIDEYRAHRGVSCPTPCDQKRPLRPSADTVANCGPDDSTLATAAPHGEDYFRWVARIGVQAAEGLAHAHCEGIIHRDVKPANLLVQLPDHVWITDFGLAHTRFEAGLSMTGDLLGTPRYMSPEQAMRGPLDARTDVYSLGVTLYELATLRPAYGGADRDAILHAVVNEDPPLATALDPGVPLPLAIVIAKAMQKDPIDRYQSAQLLADDLKCFLNSQPVQARRPTWLDLAARWQRRNPRKVITAALSMLAFTCFLSLFALSMTRAYRSESAALSEATAARDRARAAQELAESRRLRSESSVYNLQLRRVASLWKRDPQGAQAILANPALCPPSLRDFTWNYYRRLSALERRTLAGHPTGATSVAFSPDARFLASGGKDNLLRLWDLATLRELAQFEGHADWIASIAFSPDGTTLASASRDHTVRLWDVAGRKELHCLSGHAETVQSVAFAPDGQAIATASHDGTVRLWNVGVGEQLHSSDPGRPNQLCVRFFPDGRSLACGGADGGVTIRDTCTWKELAYIKLGTNVESWISSLAIHPDGQRIVAGAMDRSLWVCSVGALGDADVERLYPELSGLQIRRLALSQDGTRLAWVGNDNALRIIDPHDASEILTLHGSPTGFRDVAFSRQDDLAAACADGTIALWTIAGGAAEVVPTGWILDAAFAPAGRHFFLAGNDGSIHKYEYQPQDAPGAHGDPAITGRVRPAPAESEKQADRMPAAATAAVRERGAAREPGQPATALPKSALHAETRLNSTTLQEEAHGLPQVAASRSGNRLPSARQVDRVQSHVGEAWGVTLSSDGATLASGGADCLVKLWNADTLTCIAVLTGHEDAVRDVTFTPDGKRLISSDRQGVIRVWDVAAQRQLALLHGHADRVWSLAVSPDGRTLASSSRDRSLRFWNLRDYSLQTVVETPQAVSGLRFSADGKFLLDSSVRTTPAGEFRGELELRDAVTGVVVRTFVGHRDEALATALSPDGKTIASGGADHDILLWDAATGEERGILQGHVDWIYALQFTPDGSALVSCSRDGTTRIWATGSHSGELPHLLDVDVIGEDSARYPNPAALARPTSFATTAPHRVLRSHREAVNDLAFSPEGDQLASASADGTVKLWDTRDWRETDSLKNDASVYLIAYMPKSTQLLAVQGANNCTLWDAATGQRMQEFSVPKEDVTQAYYLCDSQVGRLLIAAQDESLLLDSLSQGRVRPSLSSAMPAYLLSFGVHEEVPGGRKFAYTFASSGARVAAWRRSTGERATRKILNAFGRVLCVSADGRRLAIATFDVEKRLTICDAPTLREIAACAGDFDAVNCLSMSPDGRWLASGHLDRTLRLWNAATGQLLLALAPHTSGATSVAFSPDGQWLVSGESDRMIHVWETAALARQMNGGH